MTNFAKIGFGNQVYGFHPFGSADWSEEVTWKIIPEFYRNEDANGQNGLVPNPLRGFVDAIKPLFQEIQAKWEIFPLLWDANKCPFPQLPALGYNVGIDITSAQNLQLSQISSAPFTIGERISGSSSNSTGYLSNVNQLTFTIISVSSPGFKIGETLTGTSSNSTAVVASVSGSGSTQTITVQAFIIGETVIGGTSGTRATVGAISSSNVNVDTVTGTGFINGEFITGSTSKASAAINGITSDGKTPGLLRSQVLNAPQLWVTKGSAKGYAIIAAFEGLLVLVTPLNSQTCAPDPNGELLTLDTPALGSYMTYFDKVISDKIRTDTLYNSPEDAWPYDVDSVRLLPGLPSGIDRSYSLRLYFFTPDDTEIEDFEAVASRLLTNLEKFRPLHVKFDDISFYGPSASTQSWISSNVYSEASSAVAWNTSISGSLIGASNSWSLASLPV